MIATMTSVEQANTANTLAVLEREECVRLLGNAQVGRLAVVDAGQPLVFPVNYAMASESPVFRSALGTKVRCGVGRPVCFEVDGIDDTTHTGWSVLVIGWLEEVTRYNPRLYETVTALGVAPWAEGERPHLLRVVPRRITGRTIAHTQRT